MNWLFPHAAIVAIPVLALTGLILSAWKRRRPVPVCPGRPGALSPAPRDAVPTERAGAAGPRPNTDGVVQSSAPPNPFRPGQDNPDESARPFSFGQAGSNVGWSPSTGANRFQEGGPANHRRQSPAEREHEGDGGSSIKPRHVYALRWFAVVPVTLAGFLLCDTFFSARQPDVAVVTGRHVESGRRGLPIYKVDAQGNRRYSQGVDADFYQQVQPGDTIHLKVTPIMGRWKEARLVRRGRTITEHHESGTFLAIIAGILIVTPLLSFAEVDYLTRSKDMFRLVAAVEVASVVGVCLLLATSFWRR